MKALLVSKLRYLSGSLIDLSNVLGRHGIDYRVDALAFSRRPYQGSSLDLPIDPSKVGTIDVLFSDGYCPLTISKHLMNLVASKGYDLIVFSRDRECRVIASFIAQELGKDLIINVVGVKKADNKLIIERSGFFGNFNLVIDGVEKPALIVLESTGSTALKVLGKKSFNLKYVKCSDGIEILGYRSIPIRGSVGDVVIGVGRGVCLDPKAGSLIKELAKELNATVVCSRPAYIEYGFKECSFWVGLSGMKISPKIYVAIGISGQVQHMVGVQGSKVVVAVNKDPEAPICRLADYVFITDLTMFLSEVLKKLKGSKLS
ncbi:MAG TPA: electron transfer flavoprotein subunit alpha/FixB family protein [Acidilobales archaeon]|nr:electron transfer flavoprotein subunit alpha/FixB family protein [Acidilobales archaeon]